jgi:DinB superfamily
VTGSASSAGEGVPDSAGGGEPASDSADGVARRTLLDRLAADRSRIASAARRVEAASEVSESAGGTPSGEWTARQVVAHLAAVETAVFQARLDQLAAGEAPVWAWTEPGPPDTQETATLEGALALFVVCRTMTLARVTGLDEAGWARAGTHATYGRLDVAGLLGVVVDHDDEHLASLVARAG